MAESNHIPQSFRGSVAPSTSTATAKPISIAYADPPYVGQAKKHYGSDEVDHKALIERLASGVYDGWALSLSSPSLRAVLGMCPEGVRVGAWVKPFASFKPGVNPAYAWEPVIFSGGRKMGRDLPTVRDWISAPITMRRGLSGAKPETFSFWIFSMLGMKPGDFLVDVFPGTGAVYEAWQSYQLQYSCGMGNG